MNMQSEQNATDHAAKAHFRKLKKNVLVSSTPTLSKADAKWNTRPMTYTSTLHLRPRAEIIEASAPIPPTVTIGD